MLCPVNTQFQHRKYISTWFYLDEGAFRHVVFLARLENQTGWNTLGKFELFNSWSHSSQHGHAVVDAVIR